MKKNVGITLILIIVFTTLSSYSFAASWFEEGYSWAKNNNIIGNKTTNQLITSMSSNDYYTMLFKYFEYSGITAGEKFYKAEDYKADNYILVATDRQLTSLAEKNWITNSEYKKAENLISNARNIVDKNAKYFTTDEINSITFYLDNMHYILYSKIYDYTYKSQIYVAKTSLSDKFIEYKLIPCYGNIVREEFLNLMYKYVQSPKKTFSTAKMIDYYVKNNVLLGYNNNLMLTARINYAEFVTFLYRM